tara:strand:- start:1151 stop:1390 length:240 start_codon:yes stop_codon:yes gene_type:complete
MLKIGIDFQFKIFIETVQRDFPFVHKTLNRYPNLDVVYVRLLMFFVDTKIGHQHIKRYHLLRYREFSVLKNAQYIFRDL